MSVRMSRWNIMSGLLLVLGLLVMPGAAKAVEGLGISPTSSELRLQPGQHYAGAVTVINDGGTDVTYTLTVTDYTIRDNSYRADFTPTGAAATISPVTWFGFQTKPTVIKAHQQVAVPYTIDVPLTSTIGGHYAVLFVQSSPKLGAGAAVVNKVVRVGSIFYLGVGGDLIEKGEVLPPELGWFQIEQPFLTTVKIRNLGNVHFASSGTAYATPLWGKKGPVVQFKGEVLPQTTRSFEMRVPARQPIGIYKVTYTFNYLGQDQPPVHRWVLLVPKLTIFILISTVIIIIGYFLLRIVNWWFHRDE